MYESLLPSGNCERAKTKYQRFEADAIEFRKYPAALEVGIYPVSSLSYDLHFGLYLGFPTWCLEKEMAAHSSILAWRIPRTKEPGGLQSMGLQRVGHD